MAMSGEQLPQGLGQLFIDGGAGRVLDVDLPPGRLVLPRDAEPGTPPAYWLSDRPARPDLWVQLHKAHARSGLWPAFADGLDMQPDRPWVNGEVDPWPVARIDALSAGDVMEGFWRAHVAGEHLLLEMAGDDPREMIGEIKLDTCDGFGELQPFGASWPGLAPAADCGRDPDEFADQHVRATDDGTSRIMLVPAARSADLITAVGWKGPCNYTNDMPLLSSMLRSWEERFGARVVEIGFDILHLTVASPPVTPKHAEHVAAEHFAFCPDSINQNQFQSISIGTIREYADQAVRGKSEWWFWWD
jgi:hypothetical protein